MVRRLVRSKAFCAKTFASLAILAYAVPAGAHHEGQSIAASSVQFGSIIESDFQESSLELMIDDIANPRGALWSARLIARGSIRFADKYDSSAEIDGSWLADGTLNTHADGSLNVDDLADGSIVASHLARNTARLHGDAFADRVIDSRIFDSTGSLQLLAGRIGNNAITADKAALDQWSDADWDRVFADIELTELVDGAITGDEVIDGSISATPTASGGTDIWDLQLEERHFEDDAFTVSRDVADGSVGLDKFDAAFEIGGDQLADNSITDSLLSDGLVYARGEGSGPGTLVIEEDGIETSHLADGSVVARVLADDAVTEDDFADDSVGQREIADGQIVSATIQNGTIRSADLSDGAIGTEEIDDGVITSRVIGDGSIRSANIADGSISSRVIASRTINTSDVRDGTVTSADIRNETIGSVQIADGSVTSDHVLDGTIQHTDIGTGAVTESELQDGSVGARKFAFDSITDHVIASNAVGSLQIEDGSVAITDLSDGVVFRADQLAYVSQSGGAQIERIEAWIDDGRVSTSDGRVVGELTEADVTGLRSAIAQFRSGVLPTDDQDFIDGLSTVAQQAVMTTFSSGALALQEVGQRTDVADGSSVEAFQASSLHGQANLLAAQVGSLSDQAAVRDGTLVQRSNWATDRIDQLEERDQELLAGVAMASAMTSTYVERGRKISLDLSAATFASKQAIGVSIGTRISDDWQIAGSVASDTDFSDSLYKLNVNFQW